MIPVYNPKIGKKELENVISAVKSGWISSNGKFVNEFEKKFADYCGCEFGVATSNGTTALHLAMATLGIGPDDEVIVPNFTIISTALAPFYLGAKPVFIDIEPDTGNIDVKKIEEKITSKTKAIIPVHMYGHPCDMDAINNLAKKYKLKVVEDAAEAHGAEYHGKKAGSLGDLACFSFYANKLITTGEGGMIVTNDSKIYNRAQKLKNLAFGEIDKFGHEEVGFNYRMTNIQAAIGVGQLENIESTLDKKIKNAELYNSLLKNISGIKIPITKEGVKNSYWMYCIRVGEEFGIDKKTLREKLYDSGIDTRDFFVPMNEQPIFKNRGFQSDEKFPYSEAFSKEGLYLPFGLDIKKKDIKFICEKIKSLKR